jgi:hypothetical protein
MHLLCYAYISFHYLTVSQLKHLYVLEKERIGHKICASVFLKLVKNIFHSNKYLESYTQDVDADRHGSSC